MFRYLILLLAFSLVWVAPMPQAVQTQVGTRASLHFSHDLLDEVMRRYVSQDGFVNFSHLKVEPRLLNRYLRLLEAVSPYTHPDLFPTWQDHVAYWLNARNALALRYILNAYPTDEAFTTPVGLYAAYKLERLGGVHYSIETLEGLIRQYQSYAKHPLEVGFYTFRMDGLPADDFAFRPHLLEAQLAYKAKQAPILEQLLYKPLDTCKQLLLSSKFKKIKEVSTKADALYFPERAIPYVELQYPIIDKPIYTYCQNPQPLYAPPQTLLMDSWQLWENM